ncbi:MAG: TAXI family TRAP transporter solute-binding subunit [Chloroflexota bacterium]
MAKRLMVILVIYSFLFLSVGCSSNTGEISTPTSESKPQTEQSATSFPTPKSEDLGTETPTSTAVESSSRPEPDVKLPDGKGAFYGKVMWGDKAVAGSTVIADTQNPGVVSLSEQSGQFSTRTDNEGDYVLIVEPDTYYIGCTLPNSDYITYETSFVHGLSGANSHDARTGKFTLVDLEANDWAIELTSPGCSGSKPTLETNTPTLVWEPYDWAKYDGQEGYYEVTVGIIEDGYQTIIEDRTTQESYAIVNSLKPGQYEWEIRAFSSSGKEIAGTASEFGFSIPSSATAPRFSSPQPSMRTQVLVGTSDIGEIADLDGAKISVSDEASKYIVETALGVYQVECGILSVPTGDIQLALDRGLISAAIIGNHPSSELQHIIDSLDARIIPWDEQAIQSLADQYSEVAATVLPANTYDGQDNEILGFTIYGIEGENVH